MTLQLDVKYRSFEEGDEEQISHFLNVVFSRWPNFEVNCSNEHYWKWKYSRPYAKDMTVLALYENEIVG